jgi:hypothetical protein
MHHSIGCWCLDKNQAGTRFVIGQTLLQGAFLAGDPNGSQL